MQCLQSGCYQIPRRRFELPTVSARNSCRNMSTAGWFGPYSVDSVARMKESPIWLYAERRLESTFLTKLREQWGLQLRVDGAKPLPLYGLLCQHDKMLKYEQNGRQRTHTYRASFWDSAADLRLIWALPNVSQQRLRLILTLHNRASSLSSPGSATGARSV